MRVGQSVRERTDRNGVETPGVERGMESDMDEYSGEPEDDDSEVRERRGQKARKRRGCASRV
jgi:hypothetical protein